MNESSHLQVLGRVSASETSQIFRDFLRGHVREVICEVMAAEVTELCGPKHAPSSSDHYRAGSSSGRVLYEGEREEVVRPRVRLKSSNGTSQEFELMSYRVDHPPDRCLSRLRRERSRERFACCKLRLNNLRFHQRDHKLR